MTRSECGEWLAAAISARDEAWKAAGVDALTIRRLSLGDTFDGMSIQLDPPSGLRREAKREREVHAPALLWCPAMRPRARVVAVRFSLVLADIFELASETQSNVIH